MMTPADRPAGDGAARASGQAAAGNQAATGRVRAAFDVARAEGRAALIPFLAAGDPDLDTTIRLAQAAAEAGADVLELGVPYSDPLADGPVIQAAYTRALSAGITLDRFFGAVERITGSRELPVVLMTSISVVMARGEERFCQDAASAGAAGLLVPDLLPEDAGSLRQSAAAAGLDTVFLTVPWAADHRVRTAATASSGFVYLVSRRGVTGKGTAPGAGSMPASRSAPTIRSKSALPSEPAVGRGPVDRAPSQSGPPPEDTLAGAIARIGRHTDAPVAVGFGVRGPADAARIAALADGVVVGSALVDAAHRAVLDGRSPEDEVRVRVAALREAMERQPEIAAAAANQQEKSSS